MQTPCHVFFVQYLGFTSFVVNSEPTCSIECAQKAKERRIKLAEKYVASLKSLEIIQEDVVLKNDRAGLWKQGR